MPDDDGLLAGVRREIDRATEAVADLEAGRAVLVRLVRAHDRDVPDPEAWALATELVGKWTEAERAQASGAAPATIRCPECRAILSNAAAGIEVDGRMGTATPTVLDCGPIHRLDYGAYLADVDDLASPPAIVQPDGSLASIKVIDDHAPVFGADDPEESH